MMLIYRYDETTKHLPVRIHHFRQGSRNQPLLCGNFYQPVLPPSSEDIAATWLSTLALTFVIR